MEIASIMQARLNEPGDLPAALSADFLFEQRLEPATDPIWTALVRERNSGVLRWLRYTTAEHAAQLATEAALLDKLNHPGVLTLLNDHSWQEQPHLIFRFGGEWPLSTATLAGWPLGSRLAGIRDLLETLNWLHTLPQPLTHGTLDLEHVWATSALQRVRLYGFEHARPDADAAALSAERQQAAGLFGALLGQPAQQSWWAEWEAALAAWITGEATAARLIGVLKRAYVTTVLGGEAC